ncbi:hypothetical protein P3T76_002244 [Phytophthora citrophthora]|uniref:Uncharacterized protein n=1 Tax=Phytophthora citrophthora TaxID=4793 RepID=A0AAD9GXR6_9STRA|nr:hypothetical protein P3T76_002244 [Phytophthora citrophthora]
MGLDELKPGNTKRARDTAISAFNTFVRSENIAFDYVKQCIEQDATGKCFVSVLDMFGMYLAFNESKKGKPLSRNIAMQYFRQAKMWLFEVFPVQRHIVEAKMLSMGKTPDNFCMKRDGKVVNKAPPCTKKDLKKMMLYLYNNVRSSSDYQDAALLCLLWYLFGRASDLALVRKQNLSVDAAEVFFIRMKTAEEQGLSLSPDTDFISCPLHAIAVALITQDAPCVDLIDNLPAVRVTAAVNLTPATSLLEILNNPEDFATLAAPATPTASDTTAPTICARVNRVLDRVMVAAGVAEALTSHPFSRGGAQHVNGCDGLTQRWIFDRDAWNMSTTNKGFNYIFNTSREDHKVSKALSGYDTQCEVKALNLAPFDAETQLKIGGVQRILFTTCYKLESSKYNISQQVADVLTAYLIMQYPQMKKLREDGLAVRRMEAAVEHAGSSVAELLAWSSHLANFIDTKRKPHQAQADQPRKESTNESKIIDHQRSVIDRLMEHIKRQDERMDGLEAKMEGKPAQDRSNKRQHQPSQDQEKPKRRRGSVTHLHATWFAWYAQETYLWLASVSKQQKSDAKLLVAFMKLFLRDGFILDDTASSNRDHVLSLGKQAEAAVLAFLAENKATSRGSGAVLKHLRALHRSGALNAMIDRHQRLLQTTAIKDPAPGYTQNILEIVSQ